MTDPAGGASTSQWTTLSSRGVALRFSWMMGLTGCLWIGQTQHDQRIDQDGDGTPAPQDCDDQDPLVFPLAPERPCDLRDNDCDPDSPDGPAGIGLRTYPSIQEAIDAASAGDTIVVCPGVHEASIVVDGGIVVQGVATAEDTIIRGDGVVPVVSVLGDGGTLKHLTLTGGGGSPSPAPIGGGTAGGGVYAYTAQAPVYLEDVVVEGNVAGSGGGIVGPAGALLILDQVVVRDNVATLDGGGIWASAPVEMTSGQIAGNTAGGDGGGVYLSAESTVMAEITDNVASRGGGGFSTAPIVGGTWRDNLASAQGGGLFLDTTTIRDCTVSGNDATTSGGGIGGLTPEIVDCTLTDNAAPEGGGAHGVGGLTMRGGTVSSNTAYATHGGGILASGGNLLVEDTRFEENTAGDGGGALASVNGTVELVDVVAEDNTAARGGGLFVDLDPGIAVGGGTVTSCTIRQNTASASGGGVWAAQPLSFTNGVVSGNDSADGAGLTLRSAATLANLTIDANTASNRGGGLLVETTDGLTQLLGATVQFNGATEGGGLYLATGSVDCVSSTISHHGSPGDAAVHLAQALPATRFDSALCLYDDNIDADLYVGVPVAASTLPPQFVCTRDAPIGTCD